MLFSLCALIRTIISVFLLVQEILCYSQVYLIDNIENIDLCLFFRCFSSIEDLLKLCRKTERWFSTLCEQADFLVRWRCSLTVRARLPSGRNSLFHIYSLKMVSYIWTSCEKKSDISKNMSLKVVVLDMFNYTTSDVYQISKELNSGYHYFFAKKGYKV